MDELNHLTKVGDIVNGLLVPSCISLRDGRVGVAQPQEWLQG